MIEKTVRNSYYVTFVIVHNKVSVFQPFTAKRCQTQFHTFETHPCDTYETGNYCPL